MLACVSRHGTRARRVFVLMKAELVDVSPTQKELKIEIAADEVRAEFDRVSARYAQQASVPGFRPGRAPVSVVRTRFKNEIRSDVLQSLVPQAIYDAIQEKNLNVIGEPNIHLDNDEGLDKLGTQPISFHAHVEVMPDVQLGEYKNIEAARRTRPVSDAMIDETIESLRENSATLEPVEDRGAEIGDTVTVNFEGRFVEPQNKQEEEPIKAEDVDLELGGEGVLPEFNEHLLGAKPDDVREFRITYPEDFRAKGLAGKTIDYKATVTAVRRKELPALDDEWAASLGEEDIDTLEKLRARIRENMEARAKMEAETNLRDAVMDKLIEANQFEVPPSLVEHQTRHILERFLRDMMQRGIDPRQQQFDWEKLSATARAEAERELRGSLLLERIAEAENIAVSDEEINREIELLAEATRQTPEEARAALTKQGGERSIADRLRQRKAVDVLIANAKITDEEWREDEPRAGAQESDAESESAQTSNDEQAAEAQS
jgi:trigger factor